MSASATRTGDPRPDGSGARVRPRSAPMVAPCAKARYRTRARAEEARREFSRKVEAPMRVYGCPDCGGVHLTSKVYRRRDDGEG